MKAPNWNTYLTHIIRGNTKPYSEIIGFYISGGGAAWFAEKWAQIKLAAEIPLIHHGMKFSLDARASSASSFISGHSPVYYLAAIPFANNGSFYILKF